MDRLDKVSGLGRAARGRRERRRRSGQADCPKPFLSGTVDPSYGSCVRADGLQLGARGSPLPAWPEDGLHFTAPEPMGLGECSRLFVCAFEDPEGIPAARRSGAPDVGVAVPPTGAWI